MVAAATFVVGWTAVSGTTPSYVVQYRLNGTTPYTDNPAGSTTRLSQPVSVIPGLYDIRLKSTVNAVDSFSPAITSVIGESDNATTLPPPVADTIINSFGEEYAIGVSGQVVVDGTADTNTSQVTLLYYDKSVTPGRVWYRDVNNTWRWKTRNSDVWTVGSDPRPNPWTIDFSTAFGAG